MTPEDKKVDEDSAKEHFVEGIKTRGEASTLKDGELPPDTTHEIEPDGEIVRRRFSVTE